MPHLRKAAAAVTASILALALVLAAPAGAQFGKNKIRYEDFDWQIYHSPHFDVYYYPEEERLLQKVVSFAESAYDELSQRFDYQIEDPTPLIFYETHSDFEQNNLILNFIPEGLGAFATPVRNRMVLPVDLPDPELMDLILHELTHIFEFHMLFGANLSKGVAATPPTWFMEGLASYMASDEGAREKMFLRDAVVNDSIPQVTSDFGGFFAYRFGHAVFEYIEEQYGEEGIRDFMIETRNTLGGRVGRALERTFGVDPEDFNAEFRRWLRQRYLPELVATGEPGDFGRPFRRKPGPNTVQSSPAASPSGDLLVAFSSDGLVFSGTGAPQVDVLLYDTRERRVIRNLTKGYDKDFQYLVAQELTLGREMGRDLSFSPDGNFVAFFGRQNRGRVLVLLNVLKGKIAQVIRMDVEQQMSPAWSPDGRTIAFSGHRGGQFDIFTVDLQSLDVTQVTNDTIYDAAPVYTPDGKSLVLTSVVGGYAKLFRLDLDSPTERFPLTHGESNDTDAVFSGDGGTVYYTSDRSGALNIFGLDLATGGVRQYTNSVTGCFQPTVLAGADGTESLVYTAFWKGRFDLYRLDLAEPITEPLLVAESGETDPGPLAAAELPAFEPAIEVTIDDRNKDTYGGFKFFLEDFGGTIGVSDDQTFIGVAVVTFSDFLGDRRIIGTFQSVESFQNFDVAYVDLSRRWQWVARVFDNRDFFIGRDASTGFIVRGRSAFTLYGATAAVVFPINVSHRFEVGGGYVFREIGFQSFATDPDGNVVRDPDTGAPIPLIVPREDDFPLVQVALVGDTVVLTPWGLVSGRRWRLGADWAPDTGESGTLSQSVSVDFRQYIPVTRRSNFAYRLFGYAAEGNFPNPIYFGGLDSIRGFDFRSLNGNNGFYSNLEFRFPLIDQLATPILRFGGIRGVLFLDIAGAWYDEAEGFRFYNSDLDRLEDAVSSYGWGFTINIFGLDLNLDFAKRWDFDSSASSFDSSIWIGRRF